MGFLGWKSQSEKETEKAVEQARINFTLKHSPKSINLREAKEKIAGDVATQELTKRYKKEIAAQFKPGKQPPKFSSGFMAQMQSLRKAGFGQEVPRQRQLTPQEIQALAMMRRQQQAKEDIPFNPWEHKDPIEVYGDDSLTFFDLDKAPPTKRTGNFFGI